MSNLQQNIPKLPPNILTFCQEKKFSPKQIQQLTNYPPRLLDFFANLITKIHFTASLFLEIIENSSDYLRANNFDPTKLNEDKQIKTILAKNLAPNQKTQELRKLFLKRCFPIITNTNDKITKLVKELNLPFKTDLKWDHTLEKHELNLSTKITKLADLEDLATQFQKPEFKSTIKELLEHL